MSQQKNKLRQTKVNYFTFSAALSTSQVGLMLQPLIAPSSSPSSSSNEKVVKAVVITTVITLAIACIFFYFYLKRLKRQRQNRTHQRFGSEESGIKHDELRNVGGEVKGLIVNENGRDVLSVKDVDDRTIKTFPKILNPSVEQEEEKRVDTHTTIEKNRNRNPDEEVSLCKDQSQPVLPSSKPAAMVPLPPTRSPAIDSLPTSPTKNNTPPSPPLPPPLPPPPQRAKIVAPLSEKKTVTPPPPPRAGGFNTSRLPPIPRGKTNYSNKVSASTENKTEGISLSPAKLKPLYWDKVVANVDHSMVWNEINDGSIRFDDDLIEALFGYTNGNFKTPQRNGVLTSPVNLNTTPPPQIFILDQRKSQNTAIVMKSLAISRKEIVDALVEGHELATDVLEKLARISPTKLEATKILDFTGDLTKLADAECFLYHILKAVPSAFTRISAMLFRSNYDADILHLKESLQTLELGCKELRNCGIFFKLLEAILKAGNRMNAGTSRGNAQGFNLAALRKLSDVKSTDGKTTLLHFVVEQVVRSEGKRCVLNRNQSFDCSNNLKNTDKLMNSNTQSPDERNKEYLLLGLPVLGALSVEFINVKKAAGIEYESFINTCSLLTTRVAEIRKLMADFGSGGGDGFVRGMKGFLEECEEELKLVREEQERIMALVKRTTDYYQAGTSKLKDDHPLQLFVIVKDFLHMAERVSEDIARQIKRKNSVDNAESTQRTSAERFPDFRLQLLSDKSMTLSSSDSDSDDF